VRRLQIPGHEAVAKRRNLGCFTVIEKIIASPSNPLEHELVRVYRLNSDGLPGELIEEHLGHELNAAVEGETDEY